MQLAESEVSQAPTKADSVAKGSVQEAVKYNANVSSSQPSAATEPNQLISIGSRQQSAQQAPQEMTQSDDDEVDGVVGPVFEGVLLPTVQPTFPCR
jgi:hypothetical protein